MIPIYQIRHDLYVCTYYLIIETDEWVWKDNSLFPTPQHVKLADILQQIEMHKTLSYYEYEWLFPNVR